MRFFRYFVHKLVSIQNAFVRRRRITQPNIYGVGSKINQFINDLVQICMSNMRIITYAVL